MMSVVLLVLSPEQLERISSPDIENHGFNVEIMSLGNNNAIRIYPQGENVPIAYVHGRILSKIHYEKPRYPEYHALLDRFLGISEIFRR